MSIPTSVVVKIKSNNAIPPVVKISNKTFKTEVK
jgi:hypothetical protein